MPNIRCKLCGAPETLNRKELHDLIKILMVASFTEPLYAICNGNASKIKELVNLLEYGAAKLEDHLICGLPKYGVRK